MTNWMKSSALHFKDYYFLSHHHDVNFELAQALIKTIDDPPMGKTFEQFSICSPVQIRSACFSFRKVSLLPERPPRWIIDATLFGGVGVGVGGNANSAATRE